MAARAAGGSPGLFSARFAGYLNVVKGSTWEVTPPASRQPPPRPPRPPLAACRPPPPPPPHLTPPLHCRVASARRVSRTCRASCAPARARYTNILQYYYTTILLHHNTTTLQHYYTATLLYYYTTYYTTVLTYYYTTILLYYYTTILLHYNTTITTFADAHAVQPRRLPDAARAITLTPNTPATPPPTRACSRA